MKKSFLKTTFYSLIITFILIIIYFLIPFPSTIQRASFLLLAILGVIFLVLGVMLIFISRKEKGKLRLFLMSTGISAVAPLVSTILHNLFYALSITFENFKYLFEALHATFFIIAMIIAPIVFIAGIIGSIILFNKK